MDYLLKLLPLLLMLTVARAADPDPVTDFTTSYKSPYPKIFPGSVTPSSEPSFVLRDVFKNGDVSSGPGGQRATLNTNIFLYPGDVTVFPRGMMHFEINVGAEPAFFISALNSQNHHEIVLFAD